MRTARLAWVVWLSLATSGGLVGCSSSDSGATPDAGGSTTSTTGGGGGGSGEPILDGGGEAASPPDGKSLCPAGSCNYQSGEGCPANATCEPSASDGGTTPACVAAGTVQTGGACLSWTDCAPGMVCAPNVCRKMCCGIAGQLRDWTGCPAGEHCLLEFDVQLSPTQIVNTGAFLCYPVNNCDALAPSSCSAIAPGKTCQIADVTGAVACLEEGTSGPTDPCPCQPGGACTRCKGGSTCVNNACRRLCKAVQGGGEPSCPATEGRCVHFTRDPDGVGECTPI